MNTLFILRIICPEWIQIQSLTERAATVFNTRSHGKQQNVVRVEYDVFTFLWIYEKILEPLPVYTKATSDFKPDERNITVSKFLLFLWLHPCMEAPISEHTVLLLKLQIVQTALRIGFQIKPKCNLCSGSTWSPQYIWAIFIFLSVTFYFRTFAQLQPWPGKSSYWR